MKLAICTLVHTENDVGMRSTSFIYRIGSTILGNLLFLFLSH